MDDLNRVEEEEDVVNLQLTGLETSEVLLWEVHSHSEVGKKYQVAKLPTGEYSCDCPRFTLSRRYAGQPCKHIDDAKAGRAGDPVKSRMKFNPLTPFTG